MKVNKTNPKSLRFNPDHLAFAMKKYGAKSEQQLIDKMLEEISKDIKWCDSKEDVNKRLDFKKQFDEAPFVMVTSRQKELTDELASLGTGSLALKRKKWIEKELLKF